MHEPRILRFDNPGTSAENTDVPHSVGAKETIISLVIAFALAFVFRGYIVEPYVIPTNSMAPTLLGAHIRWVDPANGYDWPTTHFFAASVNGEATPLPQQGGVYGGNNYGPLTAFDPMSRQKQVFNGGLPLRSGDRIFVLRYVLPLFKPSRWDVVVFKTPEKPRSTTASTGATQAYIKRLLGLPGDEVALFDGDLWIRPNDGALVAPGVSRWSLPDWKIAAKGEHAQRAVWQPVFDSRYAPANDSAGRPFQGPFVGDGSGWEIAGRTAYTYSGAGPSKLLWNTAPDKAVDYAGLLGPQGAALARARADLYSRWTLTDIYPMDEILTAAGQADGQAFFFPVSDLRLCAGVEPKAAGFSFATVLRSRQHEFRARLAESGGSAHAEIEMRPFADGQAPDQGWSSLAKADLPGALAAGKVSNVEFWHHDQQLELWIDGRLACSGSYNWTLADRVARVFGKNLEETIALDAKPITDPRHPQLTQVGFYGFGANYCRPEPWFEVSGPCTLHRVAVARDLYYQPVIGGVGFSMISAGGHPVRNLKQLGPDQYFVCGDNSPQSSDARAWRDVDPWVAADIDPTAGVVNERLMVGKAFFVYFPAVQTREVFGAKIPMVDAGRARWIW